VPAGAVLSNNFWEVRSAKVIQSPVEINKLLKINKLIDQRNYELTN
jgi:hypothetical protein